MHKSELIKIIEDSFPLSGSNVDVTKGLSALWDDFDFVDDNTLSVNVGRVRKKLETLGINNAIETKRGQGYLLMQNWG